MKKYLILSILFFLLFSLNNTHAYTVDWIDISAGTWNYVYVTPDDEYGDGSALPNPPSSTDTVLMEGWADTSWPPSSESVHTNIKYRQRFTFNSEFGNTDPVDVILSATNFGTIRGELTYLCEDCSGDVRGGINFNMYLQKISSGQPIVGGINGDEYYYDFILSREFSDYQETAVTLEPGADYYFDATVDIWINITGGFESQGWVKNGSLPDSSGLPSLTGVSFLFDLPQEIAAVPIPPALWLLGSGLIGIVGIRRKINQ
jgi:hypothetical protein